MPSRASPHSWGWPCSRCSISPRRATSAACARTPASWSRAAPTTARPSLRPSEPRPRSADQGAREGGGRRRGDGPERGRGIQEGRARAAGCRAPPALRAAPPPPHRTAGSAPPGSPSWTSIAGDRRDRRDHPGRRRRLRRHPDHRRRLRFRRAPRGQARTRAPVRPGRPRSPCSTGRRRPASPRTSRGPAQAGGYKVGPVGNTSTALPTSVVMFDPPHGKECAPISADRRHLEDSSR